MLKILFDGDGEFEVSEAGQSLLQISQAHGVPHVSVCGGNGRCSTCRVLVLQGAASVPARNDIEAALARTKGLSDDVRLACQTCVRGDVQVRRLVHDAIDRRLVMAESGARPPREITLAVLFSDIRGFTTFAESQLPYDVVHILNRYFHAMGSAIQDNGGYIDKYMGDGIMALFGLDRDDPAAACRSAIAASQDMLRRLVEENKMLAAQFDTHFKIGVGIHVGEVVIGEMGHPERMAFTAIGDTVNVASRVESSTKEAGVSVLVSDAVRDLVPELVSEDAPFDTHLKGRSGSARLYPLRDA